MLQISVRLVLFFALSLSARVFVRNCKHGMISSFFACCFFGSVLWTFFFHPFIQNATQPHTPHALKIGQHNSSPLFQKIEKLVKCSLLLFATQRMFNKGQFLILLTFVCFFFFRSRHLVFLRIHTIFFEEIAQASYLEKLGRIHSEHSKHFVI